MAELKGAKRVLKQALKNAKNKKRTGKKIRKYEKSEQFRGPRDPRSMKVKKKNLPEEMGGKLKFQKVPEIDEVKAMGKSKQIDPKKRAPVRRKLRADDPDVD
tara:strand:- start:1204 stop:1509 length:306 start_codon:yes stop_codon:yes gene_type:complete